MKPIITWISPESKQFAKALEKRIKSTFLKDWLQKTQAQEEENKAIQKFNSMPASLRVSISQKKTIQFVRNLGYKKWNAREKNRSYDQEYIQSGNLNRTYSFYIEKSTLHLVSIIYGLTEKSLLKFHTNGLTRSDTVQIRVAKVNHIILSLKAIPTTRIEAVFDYYKPLKPPTNYYHERGHISNSMFTKNAKYKCSLNFISGIKSEPALDIKLNNLSEFLII